MALSAKNFEKDKGVSHLFKRMREDIQTVFAKDPAAKSVLEVIFCYPGLHAVWLHRIAQFLWKHKLFFWGDLRFTNYMLRMFLIYS